MLEQLYTKTAAAGVLVVQGGLFSTVALNCNTAYSHFKTCSRREGRSAIDAFNDACARQPGGKAWAYWPRGHAHYVFGGKGLIP